MSTAAKTPNYNLSQVAGPDTPDWITDYTSDMSKIDAALKENADDIATVRPDEFSEESTYTAGDYCIKDNVIYKAKTAVAAGAFDISDWESTTIYNEISALNQNMTRTSNAVTSGYPVTNYDTYKENGIQHIKAVISATVAPGSAEDGYFTIGFVPEIPSQAEMFSGIYLYNSHIYPIILRVTENKNIGIYVSDEINDLGNSSGSVFVETSYSI